MVLIGACSLQAEITMKVISGVYPGVTTVELDTLAAETAATMTTKHPDYAILAARIAVSNLHKETKKTFTCKIFSTANVVVIIFYIFQLLWMIFVLMSILKMVSTSQ